MDAWVDLALMNAALAGALACLVFLATRVWKNPHIARALWLCVLLKLVAPPLYRFPIPSWRPAGPPPAVAAAVVEAEAVPEAPSPTGPVSPAFDPPVADAARMVIVPASLPEIVPFEGEQAPPPPVFAGPVTELIPPPSLPGPEAQALPEFVEPEQIEPVAIPAPEVLEPAGIPAPAVAAISPPRAEVTEDPIPWRWLVVLVWGLGSAAWVVVSLSRAIRFSRLVAQMEPADEPLRAQAAELAAAIGLRKAPEVRVVEGVVPPLLWAFLGRGVIVLPGALARGLKPEERGALLLHEMAHLRRRDHWMRRLEWLVLAAYWWHPAAWWARRELQMAEELCCDAAVLRVVPGDARAYGRALLRTMEFLSDGCVRAPALASGIGDSASLMKRRMRMIVQRNGCERPGRMASFAIIAFGVLVISGAAQQPSTDPNVPPSADGPSPGPPSASPAAVPAPAPSSTLGHPPTSAPVLADPDDIPGVPPSTPGLPPTPAPAAPVADSVSFALPAPPTATPAPAEHTPDGDRLSAMEGRLQRMEAMIERLAQGQGRTDMAASDRAVGMMARSGAKGAKPAALVEKLGELAEIRHQLSELTARSLKLSREVQGLANELGLNPSDVGGGMPGMMPGYGAGSGGMSGMMRHPRGVEELPKKGGEDAPKSEPSTRTPF